MTQHSAALLVFFGIAIFMFGMQWASHHLQKLSANRTRDLMARISDRNFLGVLFGIVMTVMIHSSGAVTSMLVGLGSAGVVRLRQVMSIVLGTAIGTTFTVQLISFNVIKFGLIIFTFSFFVYFLTDRRILKRVMAVVMGFGLIFFGLEVIGYGTESLRTANVFMDFIEALNRNPLYAIIVTSVFTAVVHSSAVTIGFAMSLAATGILSLESSFYWVFGANIGTTGTALIASLGGNYVGRRVAWAHCFYKLAGVMIFLPFIPWISILLSGGVVERSIANFHTVYNILAALVFYPGIKWGAQVVEWMFPPSSSEKEYGPKFLSRTDWASPGVAIAHAEREALRMADVVRTMLEDSLNLFRQEDPELAQKIKAGDDKVDLLTREIRTYLTKELDWASDDLRSEQGGVMRILYFTTDLESVADVIDNSIREMASKKHNLKLEFSDEGWKELENYTQKINEQFSLSVNCFMKRDKTLASKVVYLKRQVRQIENDLREKHLQRLIEGTPQSYNTSSIHLDLLSEYRRISGLLTSHVYNEFYHSDNYLLLPRREDKDEPR